MRHILKLLLITLLLGTTLFADEFKKPPYDKRLDLKVDGKLWYENADTNSDFAYNLGVYYDQYLKEYKTAEFWYKKSWSIKPNGNAANNLGYIYNEQKKYELAKKWYLASANLGNPTATFNLAELYETRLKKIHEAIKWYEKSYKNFNEKDAANNLGYLYDTILNDMQNAREWYIKAIEMKSLSAIKNLGRLYHYKLHDDVKAAEYFIALIDNKYPKKKVITYLKTKWELSDKIIKQGYEAQLKSKIIPEKLKYKGTI
jgi:uncharacterized protein